MATVDLIASTVLDAAAALMNDPNKNVYTYSSQLPYLRIALQELEEEYENNSIATTQRSSAIIPVDAGDTTIEFNAASSPALPDDLIEPQRLWESSRGTNSFVPMVKREYMPHYLDGVITSQSIWWVWQDQKIILMESTGDNDVKIDYIGSLFSPVIDENSALNIINAKTFLEYRTAALLAEFIEQNMTRSNSLNAYMTMARDRALGISIKGKQSIATRRLPFRSDYKRLRNGVR